MIGWRKLSRDLNSGKPYSLPLLFFFFIREQGEKGAYKRRKSRGGPWDTRTAHLNKVKIPLYVGPRDPKPQVLSSGGDLPPVSSLTKPALLMGLDWAWFWFTWARLRFKRILGVVFGWIGWAWFSIEPKLDQQA